MPVCDQKTKGKPGAPIRNRNSIRHGLTTGRLPKGASYISRETQRLRRLLEELILEREGELGAYHAAVIVTAVRWERHAMLSTRWLWKAGDDLAPAEKLAFYRDVARASAERDRCLEKLGLDKPDDRDDPWSLHIPADVLQATNGDETPEVSECTSGDKSPSGGRTDGEGGEGA